MRVFVSSTSDDLLEHRAAAIRGLRRLGHEVVAMEDFTAITSYPLTRVLELVRECDALVGLVAWRYGFVPDAEGAGNLPAAADPGKTSITDYEYLAAKEAGIPLLAFVLADSAAWPPRFIDGFGGHGSSESVMAFRDRLMRDHVVSFFSTPESLENQVTVAIANIRISGQVAANLVELGVPVQGGQTIPDSSYAGGLSAVVEAARTQHVVTIDIATTWWSTRLYLLAFLLRPLTDVQRILIKRGNRFVGLLSVDSVLKTLPSYHVELSRFHRKMKQRSGRESDVRVEGDAIVAAFERVFSDKPEPTVKIDVNEANLDRWFGEMMVTSPIRIADLSAATALDLVRLLDYPSDFVPVLSGDGATPTEVHVIDTRALSGELAKSYVTELLDALLRR